MLWLLSPNMHESSDMDEYPCLDEPWEEKDITEMPETPDMYDCAESVAMDIASSKGVDGRSSWWWPSSPLKVLSSSLSPSSPTAIMSMSPSSSKNTAVPDAAEDEVAAEEVEEEEEEEEEEEVRIRVRVEEEEEEEVAARVVVPGSAGKALSDSNSRLMPRTTFGRSVRIVRIVRIGESAPPKDGSTSSSDTQVGDSRNPPRSPMPAFLKAMRDKREDRSLCPREVQPFGGAAAFNAGRGPVPVPAAAPTLILTVAARVALFFRAPPRRIAAAEDGGIDEGPAARPSFFRPPSFFLPSRVCLSFSACEQSLTQRMTWSARHLFCPEGWYSMVIS